MINKKRITGLIALALCAVMVFSGQALSRGRGVWPAYSGHYRSQHDIVLQ